MPLENLGRLHPTVVQMTSIDTALSTIETELRTVTQNLTAEDRQRYGSVNETNKLFVNKVRDFYNTQPALSSDDVDWSEYEKDFQSRAFADSRLERLKTIMRLLSDFKIVHDFDNYQDALTDYDFSKYKAGTKSAGFAEKVAELKQFSPNTGGSPGVEE